MHTKAVLRILPPKPGDPLKLKQYGVYYKASKQLVPCDSYHEAATRLAEANVSDDKKK